MNEIVEREMIEKTMKHLEARKEYIPNPKKWEDVELTIELLSDLFGPENIEVEDVLGEPDTLVLSVEMMQLYIGGREDMDYFSCIAAMADEVLIQNNREKVMMDLFFENAYIKGRATKFTFM